MKEYFVLKPKNLNLTKLVTENKPDFKFNIDFAYFFISGIIEATQYELNEKEVWNPSVESCFINRDSQILQKYNQHYNKHVKYLTSNLASDDRILWKKNYTIGKCYGYQLAPHFFRDELEIYKITDKRLLKKIMESQTLSKIDNKVKKRYNFIINYLDKDKMKIVQEEKALEELYNDSKRKQSRQKYLSGATSIVNIMNGKYYISHNSATDGRIHTTITNTPKILRKYIRYEGEILAEVDLSSSIPFFLYYIMERAVTNRGDELSRRVSNNNLIRFMLGKATKTLDIIEINYFGELIMKNQLYEALMYDFLEVHQFDPTLKPDEYFLINFKKDFGRNFDGDLADLKKFAKKRILAMLFAETQHYIFEQAIFQKYFPTIHLFLKKYKRSIYKKLIGKGQHKKISYLGFQIESDLMLNHIARNFNNKFKRKKIILTIHDCLITKKKDVEILYDFMKETFLEQIGYSPNLKIEYWEEPQIEFSSLNFQKSA